MRKLTSLTTAAAIVLTSVGLSAVPAEARGRHHGGWGYRDRDNISTGGVLGYVSAIRRYYIDRSSSAPPRLVLASSPLFRIADLSPRPLRGKTAPCQ